MRRIFVLIAVLCPLVLIAEAPSLRLVLQPAEASSTVWVETAAGEGTVARHLLRETRDTITFGENGWGPRGRAGFVTWSEGAAQRWFAYTRDGGSTWSPARPLATELKLRDGATRPAGPMPFAPTELRSSAEGRLFIVQFRTISLPEWRQALKDSGVEVFNPFPYNAHLVRMDPSRREAVAALEFVERVEPYHPYYRLSQELRDWLVGEETEEPELRVRVLGFEWGAEGKARIRWDAEAEGARVAEYWPSGHVLELHVDRDQLRRLAAHDEVMWIDRWGPPGTDMDLVRSDAGTDWLEDNFGFCGRHVGGEVMDAGIQPEHQDFGALKLHTNYVVDSHGTATFGIVFGDGNRDGAGSATATGHMPCGRGAFATFSFVTDRFAHTQELKGPPYMASFQTNSWGSSLTTQYGSSSFEMDDIIWRIDIAITQSQSNAGTRASRPQAWAKNVISVGGVYHYNTLSPSDDAWASGASIGPAEDGRLKPDVHYWYDSIRTTTTGGGYTNNFGGTSAATPEVAGVLGLMVEMWSENVWGTNPQGNSPFERQPHFSTLKALLINNSQQYEFSGAGADLTRVHQGWGRPNLQIAYERAARSFIVDQEFNLELGEKSTFEIVVPEGEQELKVTMVYPDPPGTTSAALHRINDVNLVVTTPYGQVYHGNHGLNVGTQSIPGGQPNGVDTVENVFVREPFAGTWTVEVEAVEVNQDAVLQTPEADVTYALVVTGGGAGGECGNAQLELGESCEGDDLGGATCLDVGCAGGGSLACDSECAFDVSQCTGCPVCGDGMCEGFESVSNCAEDCAPFSPGEASSASAGMLLITDYDRGSGMLSLSYDPACDATDHVIEIGELTREDLMSYNWSAQECALGAGGQTVWSLEGLPANVFFVIVGQTGFNEGSYGKDSEGRERGSNGLESPCVLPQDLTGSCD